MEMPNGVFTYVAGLTGVDGALCCAVFEEAVEEEASLPVLLLPLLPPLPFSPPMLAGAATKRAL